MFDLKKDKHGQHISLYSLLSGSSKAKTSMRVLLNRVTERPQLSLSILTNTCPLLFQKCTLSWTLCILRSAFSRSLLGQ